MKPARTILKWILITMVAFTTLNLFLSSDYVVERSITINADPFIVYNELINVEDWNEWGVKWKLSDDLDSAYFDSYKKLKIRSRSSDPKHLFEIVYNGESTIVKWRLSQSMPYYIRFMSWFSEQISGPKMDQVLYDIKEVSEKKEAIK